MDRKLMHAAVTVALLAGLASCGGGGAGEGEIIWGGDNLQQGDNPSPEDTRSEAAGPGCTTSQDCPPEMPYCDQISKTCVACKKNDDCTADPALPYCHPVSKKCVQCIMDSQCPTGYQHCLEGSCSNMVCFPGNASCVGNTVHICDPKGMNPNYQVVPCGENKVCHAGECKECDPGKVGCKGIQVIQCNDSGDNYEVLQTCTEGLSCLGGKCLVCYPSDKKCEGNIAMLCKNDGSGWEQNQDCSLTGLTCNMGACFSPCSGDMKQNTNEGCEFYAVDLDNAQEGEYDAWSAQFAVIASNTSKTDPVTVTVQYPDGNKVDQTLDPYSLATFQLPKDWGLQGSELSTKAFKVNATRPITVYQFNPLSNFGVFSNDASVLLPLPNMGSDYYVASHSQLDGGIVFRGYLTVIGVSTVPVQVTYTPKCNMLAGNGVPGGGKGQPQTATISQGQVLNVETDEAGCDLTGTHVTATGPIAVFGGHEAANMKGLCCADHLEMQMPPVNTWGKHYLVSKFWERWKEKDHIKIIAAKDGTNVVLNPAITQVPVLNAGQFFHFESNVSLEVTADQPIMVAQYMASSFEILGVANPDSCWSAADCPPGYTCDPFYMMCMGGTCSTKADCPPGHTCECYDLMGCYCEAIGDPALTLAISSEQFVDTYVFLTPDSYLEDYLNVIAPSDAGKVVLDDVQIDPAKFTPIGMSGYGVYRTPLNDGIHKIWSDKRIGISVYGYDNDVSYAYPGGMGLVELDK